MMVVGAGSVVMLDVLSVVRVSHLMIWSNQGEKARKRESMKEGQKEKSD